MLPQENFSKSGTLRLLLRPLLAQSGTYSYHCYPYVFALYDSNSYGRPMPYSGRC